MAKYIDADKFKVEIEKRIIEHRKSLKKDITSISEATLKGSLCAYKSIEHFIDSLQQEQPDFPTTDEQTKEFLATHPKIKVPEKYKNPDWLLKKQEQPEVDLAKTVNEMTQENKELLLKDLCGRLPYGVIVSIGNGKYREDKKLWSDLFNDDDLWGAKPYLRPISSMTEEEKELMKGSVICFNELEGNSTLFDEIGLDWLNEHHFDFRGLIKKGLALEAPEDMYKTK